MSTFIDLLLDYIKISKFRLIYIKYVIVSNHKYNIVQEFQLYSYDINFNDKSSPEMSIAVTFLTSPDKKRKNLGSIVISIRLDLSP